MWVHLSHLINNLRIYSAGTQIINSHPEIKGEGESVRHLHVALSRPGDEEVLEGIQCEGLYG